MKDLQNLRVDISKLINTLPANSSVSELYSVKNDQHLWIQTSGPGVHSSGGVETVQLDRNLLADISGSSYDENLIRRYTQFQHDLGKTRTCQNSEVIPPVDAVIHNMLRHKFVLQAQPAAITGLLCSRNSIRIIQELFPDISVFTEYEDIGYSLFKKAENAVKIFRDKAGKEPSVLFIGNYGMIAGAGTVEELKHVYIEVEEKIQDRIHEELVINELPVDGKLTGILTALQELMKNDQTPFLRCINNSLVRRYSSDRRHFQRIALPFTPEIIQFCRSRYLYIEPGEAADNLFENLKTQLFRFRNEFRFSPKAILIRGLALIVLGETEEDTGIVLKVFGQLMKIAYYAEYFGGPRSMNCYQVDLIDELLKNPANKTQIGNTDNSE